MAIVKDLTYTFLTQIHAMTQHSQGGISRIGLTSCRYAKHRTHSRPKRLPICLSEERSDEESRVRVILDSSLRSE